MSLAQTLIAELEQESRSTRTLLSRIPDDKLGWQPHEKSMTLGKLAQHIATLPGGIAKASTVDSFSMDGFQSPPPATSSAELVAMFDQSLAEVKEILSATSDERMGGSWSLVMKGQTALTMPRIGLLRAIMLNHLYHHRGQLSVYLRLLNVPLPSIYGPSADENPWA